MAGSDQLKTSLELIKLMTKSLEESYRRIQEQDLQRIETLVFFLSKSAQEEIAEFLSFRNSLKNSNQSVQVRDNPLDLLKMVHEVYYPLFQKKEINYKDFPMREDLVITFNKDILIIFLILFYKELLPVLAPTSQIILQTQMQNDYCKISYLCRRERGVLSFEPSQELRWLAERLSSVLGVEELEDGFFKAVFSLPI